MAVLPLQEFSPPPSGVPRIDAISARRGATFRPPSRRSALLLTAIVLAACGAGFWGWSQFARAVEVRVAPVQTDVRQQVFGLGTVGARIQSNVGFKVAGILVGLNADEGDRVACGFVLARLDARDVTAQLGQAEAGVVQARANLVKAHADVAAADANRANAVAMAKRRTTLVKNGFASVEETETMHAAELTATANLGVAQSEVDVGTASISAAEAQVAFEKATLDNYTLYAPYDALVVSRNLQLGAMPVPGQAAFTLVDPSTIWVQGYVDERLAGDISLGQKAEIVLRSRPGERLPGRVARIEIQSDPVNEERLVEVAFDTIPSDIHLAEQAEVFIVTGILPRAVLVPQTAVTGLGGGVGIVWTVEQGRLAQRRVSFGPELVDGRLPIVAGLPDGADVVLAPQAGLRIGRAATIAKESAP